MSSPQRPTRDPFVVLGVPRGATVEEVRAAYRTRARRLHPDRHRRGDGTVPAQAHEAFCDLAAAYEQAVRAARSRQPAPAGPPAVLPAQRQPGAATPRPGVAPARQADPLLALLTAPQRSRAAWSTVALEVWALTLVPTARRHLAEARQAAVAAGAADLRRLTAATAHAVLTLTVSAGLPGVPGRRLEPLEDHLGSAYDALERELPPAVVDRLPQRRLRVARPGRGWGAILAR
jgi:hypothetical protein